MTEIKFNLLKPISTQKIYFPSIFKNVWPLLIHRLVKLSIGYALMGC